MTRAKWEDTLVKHLVYDSGLGKFPNISSKYLQYVRIFNLFWKETITDASNTLFEISEITILYNDWLKCRQPGEKFLSEKKIHSVIRYFLPQYYIDNSKYIPNIECSLWNKIKILKRHYNILRRHKSSGLVKNYSVFINFINYIANLQSKNLSNI